MDARECAVHEDAPGCMATLPRWYICPFLVSEPRYGSKVKHVLPALFVNVVVEIQLLCMYADHRCEQRRNSM